MYALKSTAWSKNVTKESEGILNNGLWNQAWEYLIKVLGSGEFINEGHNMKMEWI